jgi:ketosteroid isomerase-like protein
MKAQGLEDLVHRFTDAFNRHDLEGTLALIGENADVESYDGQRAVGKEAIRAMMAPHFSGAFGRMSFDIGSIICDEAKGEAWSSWRLTLKQASGESSSFRGVDVLRYVDGLIVMNSVYVKAAGPLIETG